MKSQVRLLDTLDDCIKHPLETISLSAIAGLRSLLDIYFPVASTGPSDRLYKRVVEKYMNVMKNEDNAAATRGFALALGVLPRKLVAFNTASLTSVVSTLCMCSAEDYKVGDETDAETRRNCVNALTEIVETNSSNIEKNRMEAEVFEVSSVPFRDDDGGSWHDRGA